MPKRIVSQDNSSYRFPVSVKGIILYKNHYLLLKNDRLEWELPGGKLEVKESVKECLAREIREETDLNVKVDHFVDAWVYNIEIDVNVLILAFSCKVKNVRPLTISSEHKKAGWFTYQEIIKLKNLPIGYKQSIKQFVNLKRL